MLYLYAGARRKQYEDYKKGDAPDIYLVGLNYMTNHDIEATFFENRLTEFIRKYSFNLIQLPALFVMRSYDVIFSGSGFLTLFIAKYLLRWKRPKWVIYNTYLSNLLKRNTRGLKAWVIRKAIFSADAIVCPSQAQQEFLRNIGFPEEKNFHVPFGIDYDFYNKKVALPEEVSGRYVFAAGRDVGRDFKTLVDAVKDTSVRLHIATFPRNLTRIEKMPSNVTVSHFVPAKIPALIQNSEFVVIPTIPEKKSAGSDCSGQYFLLGSMSCAKAVITSARDTLFDYFKGGEHGIIVMPESVSELREAVLSLWNNPERAKKMGNAAREHIRSGFTMEKFSEKLAKIFYKVAGR